MRTLDRSPATADAIADHIGHLFRIILAGHNSTADDACFAYSTGEAHPFGNMAVFSRSATPADVARGLAPFAAATYPSAALFLASDPATQGPLQAAADLGFVPAEAMPLMSVTPDALAPTQLPDGYRFAEAGPDRAAEWADAFSDGYQLPPAVGGLFGLDRTARCPANTARHFGVEHDGRIVATSILYLHDGLAGIYGVATRPEHRGKGLGAHATAEPLRLAWDLGYRTGILQASEMGAPVYTRLGFQTHAHMPLLARIPG